MAPFPPFHHCDRLLHGIYTVFRGPHRGRCDGPDTDGIVFCKLHFHGARCGGCHISCRTWLFLSSQGYEGACRDRRDNRHGFCRHGYYFYPVTHGKTGQVVAYGTFYRLLELSKLDARIRYDRSERVSIPQPDRYFLHSL